MKDRIKIKGPQRSAAYIKDHAGKEYGSLSVVSYAGRDINGRHLWLCNCRCGKQVTVAACSLATKNTTSCGCARARSARENIKKAIFSGPENEAYIHGKTGSLEYNSWQAMKRRCSVDPKYVSKGIKVCERWDASFVNFLKDMGEKPTPQHSLDRFPDRDGDYTPQNCRWATPKEQARNTCKTRMVTISGESKSLSEWAELSGLRHHTISYRIAAGWPDEKILTTKDGRSGQKIHGVSA